jgi:hypothetical protein
MNLAALWVACTKLITINIVQRRLLREPFLFVLSVSYWPHIRIRDNEPTERSRATRDLRHNLINGLILPVVPLNHSRRFGFSYQKQTFAIFSPTPIFPWNILLVKWHEIHIRHFVIYSSHQKGYSWQFG